MEFWWSLQEECEDSYTFLDLSNQQYSRRIAIAITKQCDAGITLDTFLLHGSEAVQAKNVLALMVSSHFQVVTYHDQIVCDGLQDPRNLRVENIRMMLDALLTK